MSVRSSWGVGLASIAIVSMVATIGIATRMRKAKELPPTSGVESSNVASILIREAEAQSACDASGIKRAEATWRPGTWWGDDHCHGAQVYVLESKDICCDGRLKIYPNLCGQQTCRCYDPVGCGQFQEWTDASTGACGLPPPDFAEEVVTYYECPSEPEPCGCEGDPRGCPGKPVAACGAPTNIGQGSLFYELPLFDLEAGFASRFSIFLLGQTTYESTNAGGPLGPHAMHSLAPSVVYRGGSPAKILFFTENAAVIPFEQTGGSWNAMQGHKATLQITPAANCAGTTTVLMADGTRYTLGEVGPSPCTHDRAEGRIQRIDRPDGEYAIFTPDANGFVETITNRRGAVVRLTHDFQGTLLNVTSPRGDEYAIRYDDNFGEPDRVERLGASLPLWDLTWGTTNGGEYRALLSVVDANGNIENAWAYTDANSTRIRCESGPGGSSNCLTDPSRIEFAYGENATTVTFTAADGSAASSVLNYSTEVGQRPRVKDRILSGSCPNCGASSDRVEYWSGTTWPHYEQKGDDAGYVTVFDSYSAAGNPLAVTKGCLDSDPGSGILVNCAGAYTESFEYLSIQRPGDSPEETPTIACATRPSAGGGTVTDSWIFDGEAVVPGCPSDRTASSTRAALARREGKTADTLDGLLDSTITVSTKTTFGGGPGGIDPTRIDGPFLDSGSGVPPSDAPRTDLEYYGPNDLDLCTSLVITSNAGRVKATKRWVDSQPGRVLTTSFCEYDNNGRPRRIVDPSGATMRFAYDWRGRVTQRIEGTFETLYAYDAAGNLSEVRLPLSQSGNRSGVRYSYDDADNLIRIDRGQFTGSGFTPLQSVVYGYDRWGNRTLTEYRNASDIVEESISSKYDAFNRLACIARPATSLECNDPALVSETAFSYDTLGQLVVVGDSQGDEVRYGSRENDAFVSQYDRFKKITQVQQEICLHTDPNGTCGAPSLADVLYSYDPALQLAQVTVKNPTRGGDIVTGYTTDDFGNTVKVVSPDSGTSFFLFDASGRLIQSQDARGKKFEYVYDRIGRLTEKRNITGTPVTEVRLCYDGYDAACGYTDAPAHAGMLTAVDDKPGSVKFTYDGTGRLIEESRSFGGIPFLTSYVYDANGNVSETTYPSGLTIVRTYDLANRETGISWLAGAGSGTIVSSVEWYSSGGLKTWYWPFNGLRVGIAQNAAGQLLNVRLRNFGPTPVESIDYAYANDGNVSELPAAVATPNILHDSLSRITQDRATASGTAVQTHQYDEAGNRLARNGVGYGYDSPANNRLISAEGKTYQFDVAGNVTSFTGVTAITTADDGTVTGIETPSGQTTYTRDYRNLRLTKAGAGGSGTFTYSPNGDLVQWTGPKYHGPNELHCAQQNEVAEITPYENYVYAGGRRLANVKSRFFDCPISPDVLVIDNAYYYVADKMDVPRTVYQASDGAKIWSAEFDAFGNPLGFVNEDPDNNCVYFTQPFRLPGQSALSPSEGGPTSTTGGLHENWNRIYGSTTGRYLQPDPIRRDLASYRYSENRPLTLIDPRGEDVVYYFDPNTRDVRMWIDTRDKCCKNTGTRFVSFGPGGTTHSGSPWPTFHMPTPGVGGWGRICTSCDGDKAAEKRLNELGGAIWDPSGAGPVLFSEAAFAQEIIRASGGTWCLGPSSPNPGCIACQ